MTQRHESPNLMPQKIVNFIALVVSMMLINEYVIQIAFQAESEYEQDQVEERHRAKVHLQRELRHWPHSQLPSKFSLSLSFHSLFARLHCEI
jgi:hypothetical protein